MDEEIFQPPKNNPDDTGPILVVPDSRGKVRNWHVLRKAPYWSKMIALCSHATAKSYISYLKERHIEYIITGQDHVNLRMALEELNAQHAVKTVFVDSGGTLNGILLRERLVNEISILINPCLVGGTTPHSIYHAPDLKTTNGVIKLKLYHVEKLKNDIIWLWYKVLY